MHGGLEPASSVRGRATVRAREALKTHHLAPSAILGEAALVGQLSMPGFLQLSRKPRPYRTLIPAFQEWRLSVVAKLHFWEDTKTFGTRLWCRLTPSSIRRRFRSNATRLASSQPPPGGFAGHGEPSCPEPHIHAMSAVLRPGFTVLRKRANTFTRSACRPTAAAV